MHIYNKHYARTNSNGIVTKVFSDGFEQPSPTDICIAEETGRICSINIYDSKFNFKYKLVNNKLVELTAEESISVNGPQKITENNAKIKQQIVAIELKQNRAIREYFLGDKTKMDLLQQYDDEIKALRVKLV